MKNIILVALLVIVLLGVCQAKRTYHLVRACKEGCTFADNSAEECNSHCERLFKAKTHMDVQLFSESSSGQSINAAGLNMIKSFEGFRSCKYRDAAGYWTIGYGHLIKPGENFNCISESEATQLLLRDVSSAESCVNSRVKVPLNGNQFSALVDFAYNLGCGALSSSTLLKDVNARRFGEVCGQLKLWVNAGGRVLPGLVRRRDAECNLFRS
jgi:lysozyme